MHHGDFRLRRGQFVLHEGFDRAHPGGAEVLQQALITFFQDRQLGQQAFQTLLDVLGVLMRINRQRLRQVVRQAAMDVAYLTAQRPADVLKMKRADIREGYLSVTQNKTGQKMRVEIVGELRQVIDRILNRPRQAIGLYLIQNDKGQPLSTASLRGGFERARIAAGVSFQFRDLRAKAATDLEDLHHAQKLLGHSNREMTEHYTRKRKGETVQSVKAKKREL